LFRCCRFVRFCEALVLVILTVPPLAYATHLRNQVWGDQLVLINEAIGEGSTKGRLYYVRATVYYDREMYDESIADATRALALRAELGDAYNIRALSYIRKGLYDDAIEDLSGALYLAPGSTMFHYNRGLAYTELKMWPEAVADYSEAIKASAGGKAYNNRGVAYAELGEVALALKDLEASCAGGYERGCENLALFKVGLNAAGASRAGYRER